MGWTLFCAVLSFCRKLLAGVRWTIVYVHEAFRRPLFSLFNTCSAVTYSTPAYLNSFVRTKCARAVPTPLLYILFSHVYVPYTSACSFSDLMAVSAAAPIQMPGVNWLLFRSGTTPPPMEAKPHAARRPLKMFSSWNYVSRLSQLPCTCYFPS